MNGPVQFVSDSALWTDRRVWERDDSIHVRLYRADSVVMPAGTWRSQQVRDPFWRFYHNQDAGAFITLDDLPSAPSFSFQPGRSYFVPAGVRFSCGSEAAFRHFYAHFDVFGVSRLLMRSRFTQPFALEMDGDWAKRVEVLAADVHQKRALDMAGQCQAKALLYEGLAGALRAALSDLDALRLAEEQQARERIAPALAYIETHLSEPIRITQLAAQCCLSPDYFARRFRECLGQTPGAYVLDQRIERAARKLLFSEDSITTIAQDSGFGSRFYLTRLFSRVLGISPAAYRNAGPRA